MIFSFTKERFFDILNTVMVKRYFNTSGPNIPAKHYTLFRSRLIHNGILKVRDERCFTIWAPRQTGKSTLFRQMAVELEKEGYKVCHINFENYRDASLESFLNTFIIELNRYWGTDFVYSELTVLFQNIRQIADRKFVLIIDEVEGINSDYLNGFLHSVRNLYHSRESHSLKSVILVGVSNITGIMQDNASPFNIADELNVPYFTDAETAELLGQHTQETGQTFAPEVLAKISEITANQPGLVNGFAKQMVDRNPEKTLIAVSDYEEVEEWYLTEAIDENVANILKIAEQNRRFLERLLFNEEEIPFEIDRPVIKTLHVNGLIKKDTDRNISFWVPLYRKRLFKALYPYSNGESKRMSESMFADSYLTSEGDINFDKLMESYRNHIRLRSFRPFREKDESGVYISIPEAAMLYSFETFISIFVQEIEGKMYRESIVSLGNSDLVINVRGKEFYIETKKYYSPRKFEKGKSQLAYYVKKAGLRQGVYIVFIRDSLHPDLPENQVQTIEDIVIKTYLIRYDEEKDL